MYGHRLVLSSQRTIYVCEYDCDSLDLIDLDSRVNSLAKYAPSAPIVLVGVKSDDTSKANVLQIEASLLSRYRKIKAVLRILPPMLRYLTDCCRCMALFRSQRPT